VRLEGNARVRDEGRLRGQVRYQGLQVAVGLGTIGLAEPVIQLPELQPALAPTPQGAGRPWLAAIRSRSATASRSTSAARCAARSFGLGPGRFASVISR